MRAAARPRSAIGEGGGSRRPGKMEGGQLHRQSDAPRRRRRPRVQNRGAAVRSVFGGVVEYLPQIGQEGLVGAHRLARGIGQLGHRLAVAAGELHHDVQGRIRGVVGQLGADAEAEHGAVGEVPVQHQGLRHRQRIREHHALGARVDAQTRVVRERLLAPFDRVARVVAQAVD